MTASNFKRVCSRRGNFETLVKQLKKRTPQTAAMKYGLEHEWDAAVKYSEVRGCNAYRVGFVINPGFPFMGASPDFLIYDPQNVAEPFGLLEIKCPQCTTIREAKYLKVVNGQLKLKKVHAYYHQVQGQMGITGLRWCDFMVFCQEDWHIEKITYDVDFFTTMHCSLADFYFSYFLPEQI